MEKADAKTVVDLCVSLDPTITALCSLVEKIADLELQKDYRDTVGMLMFHSTMIVFMMEKLYPELNPDLPKEELDYMVTRRNDDNSFVISLRLWSDTFPLEDMAGKLGLRVNHLHIKGQPKLLRSGLSKHPAQTHYLGVESFETSDIQAIEEWFDRVMSSMDAVPELKNRLLAQEITGSIVMALFPNDQYQDLSITVQNIQRAKELRVAVELEDYLTFVGGNPGYKKIV